MCQFYYMLLKDGEEEMSFQQTWKAKQQKLQLGSHTKEGGVFWFNLCCNQGPNWKPRGLICGLSDDFHILSRYFAQFF